MSTYVIAYQHIKGSTDASTPRRRVVYSAPPIYHYTQPSTGIIAHILDIERNAKHHIPDSGKKVKLNNKTTKDKQ